LILRIPQESSPVAIRGLQGLPESANAIDDPQMYCRISGMSRTKRRLMGYHRAVKTHQEMAANEAAEQEGFRTRGHRTKKHLPDSYDDPKNSAVHQCLRWKGRKKLLVNVKGKPDLPW